jgi:cytidine deaminase
LRLPNDAAEPAEPEIPVETLTGEDHELIAAARAVLVKHYRPFWHMVSAAIRSRDGRIWTGIHLGATVGRMQICAEPIALGRAILDGDGTIESAVAIRHPKTEEADQSLAVVSPCGACREMIQDYDPDARVIVPGILAPIKMPIRSLLPLPYRR